MRAQSRTFSPKTRARAKQAARAADERALAHGAAEAVAAKRRNEALASAAVTATPDLSAARSLS